SPAFSAVELSPGLAIFQQQRRRLEPRSQLFLVVLGALEQLAGAESIGPAKRPAQKRREAEAEDRPDVAVARASQHAVAEAANRLVHHLQRAALGHLVAIELFS